MASALILDGKVVEVADTEFDVHSSMIWVSDCPADCAIGWEFDGVNFNNPEPDTPLTQEEIDAIDTAQALEELRRKRNILLEETDYLALSDNTLTTAMSNYRQALRDITNTYQSMSDEGFAFPTKPE